MTLVVSEHQVLRSPSFQGSLRLPFHVLGDKTEMIACLTERLGQGARVASQLRLVEWHWAIWRSVMIRLVEIQKSQTNIDNIGVRCVDSDLLTFWRVNLFKNNFCSRAKNRHRHRGITPNGGLGSPTATSGLPGLAADVHGTFAAWEPRDVAFSTGHDMAPRMSSVSKMEGKCFQKLRKMLMDFEDRLCYPVIQSNPLLVDGC